MAHARSDAPLHKITVNLFEGDFQRLQTYYAKVGAGHALRLIIRSHLNRLDAKHAQITAKTELEAVEL